MEEIKTNQAPGTIGPYSQAIKVGGLIFTSGQIGLNPHTGGYP
jgi:2-iminobutanoate/2-iminopropanoate deaminase